MRRRLKDIFDVIRTDEDVLKRAEEYAQNGDWAMQTYLRIYKKGIKIRVGKGKYITMDRGNEYILKQIRRAVEIRDKGLIYRR